MLAYSIRLTLRCDWLYTLLGVLARKRSVCFHTFCFFTSRLSLSDEVCEGIWTFISTLLSGGQPSFLIFLCELQTRRHYPHDEIILMLLWSKWELELCGDESWYSRFSLEESTKGHSVGNDCRAASICWCTSLEFCILIGFTLVYILNVFFSLLFAVSPSDSMAFGLSPVLSLETPSLKQANGDLRLGPHWRPQSPKSPKSPKVLRLSPQESRYGWKDIWCSAAFKVEKYKVRIIKFLFTDWLNETNLLLGLTLFRYNDLGWIVNTQNGFC